MLTKLPKDIAPTMYKFEKFLKGMEGRVIQGHHRYGPPDPDKQFLRRLTRELAAYKRTKNQEHLMNVAVYAFLETYWPSEPNFHDATVDSVTRRM